MQFRPTWRSHIFLVIIIFTSAPCNSLFAQEPNDPNEGSRVDYDPSTNTVTVSWWGRPGRTYFIQRSEDLMTWSYVPVIKSGEDQVIQHQLTSTSDRLFLRLKYSDIVTNDPMNADFDGDGKSNNYELLNGTDPLDFYNGTLPTLTIVNGADQQATVGSICPLPFSVKANAGIRNAPITFTVISGDALISETVGGVFSPSKSVETRATEWDDGTYVAQVYVQTSNTLGDVSIIQALAKSGSQTVSVNTTATAIDPTPDVVATSDSTAELSWEPADTSQATTVMVSTDGGATWSILGTLAPGGNHAIVTDLAALQPVQFRILTGGNYTGGSNSLSMLNASTGSSSGAGGSTNSITPGAKLIPGGKYATLDISRNVTTKNVKKIALDDNGLAAFAVEPPTAWSWNKGTVSAPNTLTFPNDGSDWYVSGESIIGYLDEQYCITPDGTIFGTALVAKDVTGNNGHVWNVSTQFGFRYKYGLSPADHGSPGFTWPPDADLVGQEPHIPWSIVETCGANGVYAGASGVFDDIQKMYSGEALLTFIPFGVSDNGNAIGESLFGGTAMIWTGSNIISLGYVQSHMLESINNQADVIGYTQYLQEVPFIWQNGNITALQSLIPTEYQSQISNLKLTEFNWRNRQISNAGPSGIIHIQITATHSDPLTGKKSEKMYILSGPRSSLSSSTTSIKEVKFPAGLDYSHVYTINSNSVLAVIGPASGSPGSNHAQLLLPVELVDTKDGMFDDQCHRGLRSRKLCVM